MLDQSPDSQDNNILKEILAVLKHVARFVINGGKTQKNKPDPSKGNASSEQPPKSDMDTLFRRMTEFFSRSHDGFQTSGKTPGVSGASVTSDDPTPDHNSDDDGLRIQKDILDILRQVANPIGRPEQRITNRLVGFLANHIFGGGNKTGAANNSGQSGTGSFQPSKAMNTWFDRIARFFGDKNGDVGTFTGRRTWSWDEMDENGKETRHTKSFDRDADKSKFIEDLRDAGKVISNVTFRGDEVAEPMTPLTRAMEAFADWMGVAKSDNKPPTQGEDKVAAASEALCEALDRNTDAQNGTSPTAPGGKDATESKEAKKKVSPLVDFFSKKLNVPVATIERFAEALGVAAPPLIAGFVAVKLTISSVVLLGKALKKLTDEAWATTQKLAIYNGALAYGAAMLDVNRTMRGIHHADAIARGGLFSGKDRFVMEDKWERALAPLKEATSVVGNDIGYLILHQLTGMVLLFNNMLAAHLRIGATVIDILSGDPGDMVHNMADVIARPMKNKADELQGKGQPAANNAWDGMWAVWAPEVIDARDRANRANGARQPLGPQP